MATSTSTLPGGGMPEDARSTGGKHTGAIVGGVIGALCGVGLLSFIFWCWWRRRNRRRWKSTAVLDDQSMVEVQGSDRHATVLARFFANNKTRDSGEVHNNGPQDVDRISGTNIPIAPSNAQSSSVQRTIANPDPATEETATSPKQREALGLKGTVQGEGTEESLYNPHPIPTPIASSSSPQSENSTVPTAYRDPPEGKPPLIRLSIDGLHMEERREPTAGGGTDNVVELQRRVEALTRENEILTLNAQPPPAYH
ncbi:hypothetical protein V5O48_001802 [Marasmius crinis-equi]|uniref:Uncharacterized protein n=1 Tax=Marasmius crinis-equi TaxID=585013 RepID=A0ABR3FXD7_9AGAR